MRKWVEVGDAPQVVAEMVVRAAAAIQPWLRYAAGNRAARALTSAFQGHSRGRSPLQSSIFRAECPRKAQLDSLSRGARVKKGVLPFGDLVVTP